MIANSHGPSSVKEPASEEQPGPPFNLIYTYSVCVCVCLSAVIMKIYSPENYRIISRIILRLNKPTNIHTHTVYVLAISLLIVDYYQ